MKHCTSKKSYMVKVLRIGEPELSVNVSTPYSARLYWSLVIKKQRWFDADKEQMVVLLLSVRFNVQGYSLVGIGSLNETIAHPREVFRAAVAGGSYGIVVMHNHPSGHALPSENDRALTRRLSESAQILQIPLVDHIIMGRRQCAKTVARTADLGGRVTRRKREAIAVAMRGYFSFKEAGLL